MQGVHATKDYAGTAGAGQSGCNLLTDIPRLTDADDHDFATAFQRIDNRSNGSFESLIQLASNRLERSYLDSENFSCFG